MSRFAFVLAIILWVALAGSPSARAAGSMPGDDIVVPHLRRRVSGRELANATDGSSYRRRVRHSRWHHEVRHRSHRAAARHRDARDDSALDALVPDLPPGAGRGSSQGQDDSGGGTSPDAATAAMDLVSHPSRTPVQPVSSANDNTASEPDIAMPTPPVVHRDSRGRVPVTSSDSDSDSDNATPQPEPQAPSDSGDADGNSSDADSDSDAATPGDSSPTPVSSSAANAGSDIVMPQAPARAAPELTLPSLDENAEQPSPAPEVVQPSEPAPGSLSIPAQDLTGTPQPMRHLRMGLGFAMVAVMAANIATSTLDHEDHFLGEDSGQFSAIHHGTEYVTFGGLGALSLVELLSEDSHSVWHKIGFLASVAATLAQAGLLYETDARVGYVDQIEYSRAHLVACWVGAGAMALSSISLAF